MSNNITLEERQQLGKEKKLWRINVLYSHEGEQGTHYLDNQTDYELMNFRKNVFLCGLMLPKESKHWIVIPPYAIIQIDVYKQLNFFEK